MRNMLKKPTKAGEVMSDEYTGSIYPKDELDIAEASCLKFKDKEEQELAKMEAHLIASALEHIDCDGPSEQEIAQKEMELMASAMEHIKAMETLPTEEECAQWADNLVDSFFKNRGQTECSGNC